MTSQIERYKKYRDSKFLFIPVFGLLAICIVFGFMQQKKYALLAFGLMVILLSLSYFFEACLAWQAKYYRPQKEGGMLSRVITGNAAKYRGVLDMVASLLLLGFGLSLVYFSVTAKTYSPL